LAGRVSQAGTGNNKRKEHATMVNFAFFYNLGLPELLILLVIVLLLFGHRLPGLGRSMGRSVSEFKEGIKDGEDKGEKKTDGSASESSEKEGDKKS
jgi:TatA/E family protein of Tat protein translocase